jgi:2-methylisocitrate lyase-like PEP mutase family enzyme
MAMSEAPVPAAAPAELSERRAGFRALHDTGCFVIPNPWDAGTARYLRSLGFKALATTSAGFAFSKGLSDSTQMGCEMVLAHVVEMVRATDLPLNVDFQDGYSSTPEGVAVNVRRCIQAGAAGVSIEDATGNPSKPLYELPEALERLKAARAAVDASRSGVLLTARAECYLVGHPDPLKESLRRLEAYAKAGADVLYAPGPRTKDEITAIVSAVSPKPVNVIMSSDEGLSVRDLADLGVRRISVGSALARAAWTGFIRAATLLAKQGSFEGFTSTVVYTELDKFFRGLR